MIRVIPAIDIIEGRCVRLEQGSFAKRKTYEDDPVELARKLEDHEIRHLHLVDLDGARNGRVTNYKVLERIATKTSLSIDFGGGIASDDDLRIAFECGAAQISAGSVAIKQRELFISWLQRHGPEKIILAADVREERVAISGWEEDSGRYVYDLLNEFNEEGLKYALCTDIAKDGMLQGPSLGLYQQIIKECKGISLIASGGISSVRDIADLEERGVPAVVVGKALLEGKIPLVELKRFNL